MANSFLENLGKTLSNTASTAGNVISKAAGQVGETLTKVAADAGTTIGNAATGVSKAANDAKESVTNAIDQNGNGQIDIEDIIILGLKTPGVRINRAEFLKAQLSKEYPQETVEKAIATTPTGAGIPIEELDKMADASIAFERNMVSGISTALGVPGGFAMAATIPADMAQYYGYTLRAMQKMMYLYGFPDLGMSDERQPIDDATLNVIILCLGIMNGVAGANNALKAVAKALGVGMEKQLLKKALTKGALYPFVKSVAKWFGVKMTKEVFAGFFKKAIPVVGGVLGGTITYVSFGPCCNRLKESLRDTYFTRGDIPGKQEEDAILEMVEAEESTVE